jgi:hypothetical protein
MAESTDIDAAVVMKLVNDLALQALLPDGVYFDFAKQGATRYAIVKLADAADEWVYGGRAFEDNAYLVEAVVKSTSGGNVDEAAARIDALLDGQPLTVPGYTWMTMHREQRTRRSEPDASELSIRWQYRGGIYRVQMSLGS